MKSQAASSIRNHTFKSGNPRSSSARAGLIARVLLALMFFSMLVGSPDSIVPNRVLAADGELVQGFGTNGFVATDFFGGHDTANAITATRRGKIIAAGSATAVGAGTDFAVACYDSAGNLDPTFGQGGKTTADFFGGNDGARGVAVQLDGKIVLSGFATNGAKRLFALARFTDDGQLDTAFGQGGKLSLDLGLTSEAFKVALQGDGKIVAVGDSRLQNNLDFTVIRLNQADGSLDNSFSDDGVARIDFGFTDRAIDLAIDDSIYVAGIAVKSATDSDFALASLNLDGSPNNTFDNDAKLTTDFFLKQDGAQAITLSGDGITVAGFATNETSDFAVARYNRRGDPILSFGRAGKQYVNFSDSRDLAFGVINQPDGNILATGWAGIGTGFDLGMVRFNGEDGSLDSSFGLQGRYTHDAFSGTNNVGFDAILYEDTILTAGVGLNPVSGNDDWIITQHENEKFVEFTKEVSPNPAVIGDIVTYTFTIRNRTDKRLTVRVTDFLPQGVSFGVQDGWRRELPAFPSDTLVSSLIDLPPGETRKRFLRVTADQNGPLKNEASLFTARPIDFSTIIDEDFLAEATVESEVKAPEITDASVNKKSLTVRGLFGTSSGGNQSSAIEPSAIEPLAKCPVILIDGQEQKTKPDPDNPTTVLIAPKGGKGIARGQTVTIKVRLCDGTETAGFTYTRPQ